MAGLTVWPILPKRPPFGTRYAVEQAMHEAMVKLGQDLKADLEKTAVTWDHKPQFSAETTNEGVRVTTDDAVWNMVNSGTKAHVISPKGDYPLRFKAGSKPKTKVRVIGSTGGSEGRDWVSPRVVRHPGTAARQFTQVLNTRWRLRYSSYFKNALKVAAGQT